MSPRNVEIVQSYCAAWERGKPHAAHEFVSHDFVVRSDATDWQPAHGLTETREMLSELLERGVSIWVHTDRFEDLGDYVIVHGRRTTIRAGEEEVVERCWVFHLRNGKIASITAKRTVDEAFEHVEWDRR